MTQERLQKFLASRGYGSRRQIEGWITEKRIKINNKLAKLGDKVDEDDKIMLNGKLLKTGVTVSAHQHLVMNKPLGRVCTRKDEEGRKTVFDLLPGLHHQRWINVGRLDINSSGLLIFTTDGELAHRLMHPSSEIEREYLVRVIGKLKDEQIRQLMEGVMLEDEARPVMAKFEHIRLHREQGANNWYRVTLREGRNREVRRLLETQGVTVNRLTRTRFGSMVMQQKLKPGEFYELSRQEINQLYKLVKLEVE